MLACAALTPLMTASCFTPMLASSPCQGQATQLVSRRQSTLEIHHHHQGCAYLQMGIERRAEVEGAPDKAPAMLDRSLRVHLTAKRYGRARPIICQSQRLCALFISHLLPLEGRGNILSCGRRVPNKGEAIKVIIRIRDGDGWGTHAFPDHLRIFNLPGPSAAIADARVAAARWLCSDRSSCRVEDSAMHGSLAAAWARHARRARESFFSW